MRLPRFALVAVAFVALPLRAPAQPAPAPGVAIPAARPNDVMSVDSILAALYASISTPAGTKLDPDRFRSLFAPDARLIPTGPRGIRSLTVEQYIRGSFPVIEQNGFYEREIARTVEQFGGIVQAFSTYESRHSAADPAPFARGINSIQLYNDRQRWYVVTIFWQAESAGNPIPAEYLPK